MELTTSSIYLSHIQASNLELNLNNDELLGKKWDELRELLYKWKLNSIYSQIEYTINQEQASWIISNIKNDTGVKQYTLHISDNIETITVKNLLIINNNLRKNIFDNSIQIKLSKEKIRENEKLIWNNCSHKWEYDSNSSFDEKTKYSCSYCGLWRNEYMYR
tara:strand:+ start:2909 stop:3394 length:486 start_codon:yes stop_codon:yes gene_type:complete